MAVAKTKVALESRLVANFPAIPIAGEAVGFAPTTDSYFSVNLQVNRPDDPIFGSLYRRENFVFQVFYVTELNKGSNAAYLIAEQVQSVFKRGTFISVDNLRIHVFTSPQIGSAVPTNNKLVIPVRIPVTTEVQV